MPLIACFSPAGLVMSPMKVFNEAVAHSGQIIDDGEKERLLSLEGVRNLILERNYELVPFYKLMRNKYGSSSLHGTLQKLRRRFTSVLAKSKAAQGKTSGTG